MFKINVSDLKPDMKLARPICNQNGNILLDTGTRLTLNIINKLTYLGIDYIYIERQFKIKDVITKKTRTAAINQVKKILSSAKQKGKLEFKTEELYSTINNFIYELLSNKSLMFNLDTLRTQDNYTFAHSVNVSILSLMTGITLGFNQKDLKLLGAGALLHDLGKIHIPDYILNKPDRLSPEEFSVIKKHSYYGYKLLIERDDLGEIPAVIALQHHEHINGSGYPYGLKGKQIHRFAQVTAIADKFDAVTSDRVYKKGCSSHEAFEMCAALGGYLIDHDIVKAFLHNIAVYPPGTHIQLNNGQVGVALDTPKKYTLFPNVKILYDTQLNKLSKPKVLSLVNEDSLHITKILSEEEITLLN
ncbi:MAG: HD-GYP domain-containing protein [Clostridiales bacterium]|nr:HD-GYP domain-containing protein [Clostridiales bacterium]MCF8022227.1 HD-GYP domain-containing protein [Clostridiales bacterium]